MTTTYQIYNHNMHIDCEIKADSPKEAADKYFASNVDARICWVGRRSRPAEQRFVHPARQHAGPLV